MTRDATLLRVLWSLHGAGNSTVDELTRISGFARSTVWHAVRSLKRRGLMVEASAVGLRGRYAQAVLWAETEHAGGVLRGAPLPADPEAPTLRDLAVFPCGHPRVPANQSTRGCAICRRSAQRMRRLEERRREHASIDRARSVVAT